MEGQVSLGRGIAAVGIVLGLIAIWVDFGPASYWSFDGSLGGLLLILELLALLALAGAYTDGSRNYDIAYGAIGGVGFGLYLFYPALAAFEDWGQLDAGAWLGLCSALTFIGASIATWPSDRPAWRPSALGTVVALAGLALVVAGIFPNIGEGGGSYWDAGSNGHSFAIVLIALVVLEALSILAAWSMASGMDSAVLLGAVTFGAVLAIPARAAFDQFGQLGAGAWLAGIGGIVLIVGVLIMRQMADEGAPAPSAPPQPTPPAA
ncbi:MAG: hypothetical protein H0W87_05920 [Actinobacteria bacterium]|nr:hypothetical protein [Actinomycetota bacterium]